MRYFLIFILIFIVSCSTRVPNPYTNNNNGSSRSKPATIEELIKERDEAKELVTTTEQKIESLNKQIEEKRIEEQQALAKTIGGISLILGTILCVASLFTLSYPILPKLLRVCGAILVTVGAISFGVSAIIPHLLIIGVIATIIVVGACIVLWRRDRLSLRGVVASVEAVKPQLSDYKDTFRCLIGKNDKWIDEIRKKVTNKVTDKGLNSKK